MVREVAETGGFSMATARTAVIPFLSAITRLCKPRSLTVDMAAWYELDEAGVSYITGSGETTKKVASIVEDATERRSEALEAHAGSAFTETEEQDQNQNQSTVNQDTKTDTQSPNGVETTKETGDDDYAQSTGTEERDASTTESASDTDTSADADTETEDDGQAGLSEFM